MSFLAICGGLVFCYSIFMTIKSEKKVFATVLTNCASGREVLAGILRYLSKGSEWNLHLLQTRAEASAKTIGKALEAGADGLLLTFPGSSDVYETIAASRVPVVCVNIRDAILSTRTNQTRFVWNDNAAIGRLAADYFAASDAYASFAFLGDNVLEWSRGRELGFRAGIAKTGHKILSLTSPTSDELMQWLLELPKPAALFAATDNLAAMAITAARRARIAIPEKLAVLGVDDAHRVVGGIGLSSIVPGHEEMGYAAARTLDQLMRGRRASSEPITVAPLRLVARASTKRIVAAERVVKLARQFIAEHACDGIGVDDVVAFTNVSRSTLEHRFRELTGLSVREAIEIKRLERAKALLRTSNRSLALIAEQCGFSSATRLSHVFALRFGQPPGAFREK